MRNLTVVTLLLSLMAINGYGFGPTVPNPVTSSIAISDANGAFSLAGDGAAYQNGVSSVVSQIQGIGDWELNMLASTNRRVYVNFDDLVAGSNPANLPAPPSGLYPVRFITQCSTYGFNLLNLTSVGQSATCGLVVAVDIGAVPVRYSLRFYARNYPGTSNVTVGCISAVAGKCSGWRIQSPNGDGKAIARVYKETRERGKTILTSQGDYRFSFDMSFSKP